FLFLMLRHPPTPPLFPYTTLFRSNGDQEEPLNPERYFAVHDDTGEMTGFYYFEPNGDVLDYGLGLRPDLTGGGRGLDFFRAGVRSEEHTSELQSLTNLLCRLLL